MVSRLLPLSLLPLLLLGCTSWKLAAPTASAISTAARPPAEVAKICVVRTAVLAQAVTFPTHDNGVLVGATQGPTHFCYLAEPGQHEIVIQADEAERATLTAEAGKSYVLKEEVDFVFGYVKCRALWMNEAAARELFEDTDYQVLVGVPGTEKLPAAPPFAPAKKW